MTVNPSMPKVSMGRFHTIAVTAMIPKKVNSFLVFS